MLPACSSSSACSLFGFSASSFHSPHSLGLCFFSLYSFLLHVFLCETSLHLRFVLPIFGVQSSAMFSLLHLPLSFSPHILNPNHHWSVYLLYFLNYFCHTSSCSYLFSLDLLEISQNNYHGIFKIHQGNITNVWFTGARHYGCRPRYSRSLSYETISPPSSNCPVTTMMAWSMKLRKILVCKCSWQMLSL